MSDKELVEYLMKEKEEIKDAYWMTNSIFGPVMGTLDFTISVLQNRLSKPVISQEKEGNKTMDDGMFLVVEATDTYNVCYETITGVMYLVTNGGRTFTIMVDGEGKPLTYYRWRKAKNNREKC